MRKTKIVCTIGPACSTEKVMTELCLAGMNVARLNFSHGTHEQHLEMINLIKSVREKLNLPIAIMLDTKGPEYRIKSFKDGKIALNDVDTFTFTTQIGNNINRKKERFARSFLLLYIENPTIVVGFNRGLPVSQK